MGRPYHPYHAIISTTKTTHVWPTHSGSEPRLAAICAAARVRQRPCPLPSRPNLSQSGFQGSLRGQYDECLSQRHHGVDRSAGALRVRPRENRRPSLSPPTNRPTDWPGNPVKNENFGPSGPIGPIFYTIERGRGSHFRKKTCATSRLTLPIRNGHCRPMSCRHISNPLSQRGIHIATGQRRPQRNH